jgi:hypothetical protein
MIHDSLLMSVVCGVLLAVVWSVECYIKKTAHKGREIKDLV